jgi:hypothetical protein
MTARATIIATSLKYAVVATPLIPDQETKPRISRVATTMLMVPA